jgi:hypothetical protein
MITMRMPTRPQAERTVADGKSHPVPPHDEPNAGLLEGELLDLYAAILIVVPLALFLKSLWS